MLDTLTEKRVWIKTYGCQMNVHDSERILAHLKDLNYVETKQKDQADLIIFNTCAIRDKANLKFYSGLGEFKKLKSIKKDLIIGVGGCVGQSEGRKLIKKYPYLNFTFGTDVIDRIPEFIERAQDSENHERFSTNVWDKSKEYSIETKITHNNPQAFVNIIKGCDKFCSYCIVPFTRGREKSRKIDEIVIDVQKLVSEKRIQEITLLGQNVNSFGKERGESLAQLISKLEHIDGLEIIRYTTSHPYDISDELIELHGTSKKLANHLHLPVQSGSNSVLKRMNREYTIEHYESLVKRLRAANPNLVLATDIIVGFPNETDEEFQATMDLLSRVKFDFLYSFYFSPRLKTKAACMEDKFPIKIKKERLWKLQEHQIQIQIDIRKEIIGEKFVVLVEGKSLMKGEEKWRGRTNCMRIVHFLSNNLDVDLTWHWVEVQITSSTALSCQSNLIQDFGLNPPKIR